MDNRVIIPSVLVILVVALIGFFLWNKPVSDSTPGNPQNIILSPLVKDSTPSNPQNIILSPLVKGCAETDKGMATKALGEGTEQEPKIDVNGNGIVYSRSINHLCCRKAEI
ncbi:MAG: hypothetical protein ABH851_00885, partial [Methanobacteriota archaeon]